VSLSPFSHAGKRTFRSTVGRAEEDAIFA